eukprot:40424-Eustigmatos_ZCMA.PRE.1
MGGTHMPGFMQMGGQAMGGVQVCGAHMPAFMQMGGTQVSAFGGMSLGHMDMNTGGLEWHDEGSAYDDEE